MSRSGHQKFSATAQGPYGPDNPPPPPPGRAPGDAERERGRGVDKSRPPTENSRPPKGNGRAYNHRKLNSRQRKQHRKPDVNQAKQDERTQRARSRSPAMRERDNSQSTYRERSPVPRIGELYEGEAGQGSRVQRRETLRGARQITPDQILDEARERLSPGGVAGGGFYGRNEKPQRQNTERIWPDEPAQPHHPANDMHGSFNSRHNNDLDKCATLPLVNAI